MQRLRELGWIEGRTVAIEYRWAEARNERTIEIAAEFVRLKVDLIFTAGPANVVITKRATAAIPIVFALASDPVGLGLVASLARPGGNVTGLSTQSNDLGAKRVELLREAVPRLRQLGVLANFGDPGAVREVGDVQAAAGTLGLEVRVFQVRRAADIAPAFDVLKGLVQALNVVGDPLTTTNASRINTLALVARMPTVWELIEPVEAGGLMSYAPNFPVLFRRAAELVDKILRGTKPADIPVEQPTKFELAINLITAKAIGLEISPFLLARADKVIE